jgi:NADH:ubiquinone oxidoreductase subunit 3 (subunit A)
MEEFFPVIVYLALVAVVTLVTVMVSVLVPSKKDTPVKFMPYESGIQTQTDLLHKRFPMRHYLVALIFLVFDVEVIFFYPWAVIGKEMGAFALYEMGFFLVAVLIGFGYVWQKGGFEWE